MKTTFVSLLAALTIAVPANASLLETQATLLGTNETPPNASPATGFIDVTLDTVADTLMVHETFSGLESPATAAHIHCCAPPGIAAPVRLPFLGSEGFPFRMPAEPLITHSICRLILPASARLTSSRILRPGSLTPTFTMPSSPVVKSAVNSLSPVPLLALVCRA
jgi:hypothetical protein